MKYRKTTYTILSFLILFVLAFYIISSFEKKSTGLKIAFLDVSQGDAILISQGSQQVLIDGGPDGKVLLEKLGTHVPFWDRLIETVIATHPDHDHLRGLADVVESYDVGAVIVSPAHGKSSTYSYWDEKVEKSGVETIIGKSGMKIIFSGGAMLEFFHPRKSESNDEASLNDQSIVTQLHFGENKFLLTGDIPDSIEEEMILSGISLRSNVLKVSHHGSKYSTGESFLEKVAPAEAIISVGADNRYGHPTEEVLGKLRKRNIKILRTDESGDIIYTCSGPDTVCLLELEQ